MNFRLAEAKPYELPNAVRNAFRVISSPQFFMRIAARTDEATNDLEKEKLSALASNLVNTLEAVVETTEEKVQCCRKTYPMLVSSRTE